MKLFLRTIFFLIAIIAFAPLAQAQTYWTGDVDGRTFEIPGNWSFGVPNGVQPTFIETNATITLSSLQSAQSLTIGSGATVTLTVGAPDSLTIVGEVPTAEAQDLVINNGSTFTLSGGTLNLTEGIGYVGGTNGTGTFNLTSGTFNFDFQTIPNATQVDVGNGGTGTVNQSGNSVVTTGNVLFIGTNSGTGNYNLTGSSILQTGSVQTSGNYFIVIGANTSASQTTAGTVGTLTVSGDSTLDVISTGVSPAILQLGTAAEPFGSTMVPAGTVGGTGILIQNGAGSTVNLGFDSYTSIGSYDGGSGTYDLEAGTLTMSAGSEMVIGDGTNTTGVLDQSGGTFNVAANAFVIIGNAGQGSYILSGGAATFGASGFTIGGQGVGSGTVTQSGGALTSGGEVFVGGGAGTGAGVYNLSGGTSNINQSMALGGNGTVNQTGGTMTIALGQALILDISGGSYNLNGGTLQVGNSGGAGNGLFGTTGEGTLNFGGGTLQVLSGSTATLVDGLDGSVTGVSTIDTTYGNVTLNGNLTGNGTLDIIGGNTVTLNGTNNVADSWGATISANSTLTAASVTSLSHTGTYMIGSGSTFNLNNTGAGPDTFAGNISDFSDPADPAGTASFNTGTDKLILAGQTNLSINSVTTIGAGGSLEVDNGTISNVHGSAGNAADTFDVGSGTTTGKVTLLGTNNFGTGLVTVNTGSTLFAGDITGSVTNHGTLGTLGTFAAPATLTIGGAGSNLTSTGTLLINTNGTTADSFTLTGGGSTATLSGVVKVTGTGTNSYNIVTAPGTITIGGNTMLNNAGGLIASTNGSVLFAASLDLSAGDTVLQLNTTERTFAQAVAAGLLPSLTPNETAVAGALDPFIANGVPYPSAFSPILTVFNQLPASQIPGALEELTPENLQYARNIAFENSTFLAQNVDGWCADLRSGYGGLDTNAVSVITPGFDSSLGRSLGSLLAYDDPVFHQTAPNGVNYYPGGGSSTGGGNNSSSSSSSAPAWDSSTQVISDSPNPYMANQKPSGPEMPAMSEFIGGDVILADLNQNQSAANAPSSKATYTAGDATAGISFRLTPHLVAGVLFDYNHTDAKTDSSGSKTTVDSYSPGLFATYFDHGFYVNGIFSYGYNNYSNTRDVSLLSEDASSHPHGRQYVGDLDAGYDFHPAQNWVVGPTAGIIYTHLDIDSFTETGAPGADLAVNTQSADSLRSRLGGHVLFQTDTGDVLLQPNLTVMWQHEYLDGSSGITSSFNDFSSNPFTIQTAAPSRDSALIGCGLTATLNNSMALYLNYIADIGADDYWAQSVVGGFKARF